MTKMKKVEMSFGEFFAIIAKHLEQNGEKNVKVVAHNSNWIEHKISFDYEESKEVTP
jgi:hypothetical protein